MFLELSGKNLAFVGNVAGSTSGKWVASGGLSTLAGDDPFVDFQKQNMSTN